MPTLCFVPPCPPWSTNQERARHWSFRHRRTKLWREAAAWSAQVARCGPQPPSVVRVALPFTRGGRRDASNFMPAVKGLVDGLVDAGLFPDDCAPHVHVEVPTLHVGATNVVVTITPIGS